MRRFVPVVLLVLALVAGACSGDDDTGSAANTSIPDKTTTSSTTTQPDTVSPDVIPTDESRIDEAYVQAVVDAHMALGLEALVLTMDAGLVDEAVTDLLSDIHTDESAIDTANGLAAAAIGDFAGIRESPGPLQAEVLEVRSGTAACLIIEVRVDESASLVDPIDNSAKRTFIEFNPASEGQKASGLNFTAWVLHQFPVTFDGSVPEFACDE